jgi:hypothetical protein
MPGLGSPSWSRVFPTFEILSRLDWLVEWTANWGLVLLLSPLVLIALVEAIVLPHRLWAKGAWVGVVALCAVGTAGLLRAERHHANASEADSQQAAETAALHGLWTQWDDLSKTLPPSNDSPPASFDSVDDALASLNAKVAIVKDQVAALQTGAVGRAIEPTMAGKLADYLRQYGSYRVVVSCAPSDLEAYSYANQLIDVLKSAGWDAHGPEATANITEGPAMGVSVLVRDPTAPDAAKILIDAFNQFDIPHQPGISADNAIPDGATVELFVAKKP